MHILNKAQRKEAIAKIQAEKDDKEASESESKFINRVNRREQSYETAW
jgi:hypothetical protein